MSDLLRKSAQRIGGIHGHEVRGDTGEIDDTTSTEAIAAQGAGVHIFITEVLVTNADQTDNTIVQILDGSTVIFQGFAASNGGGFFCNFTNPIKVTANAAVNVKCLTAPANGGVFAFVNGFKLSAPFS